MAPLERWATTQEFLLPKKKEKLNSVKKHNGKFSFPFYFEIGFHPATQAGLEFEIILLPQSPSAKITGLTHYTQPKPHF